MTTTTNLVSVLINCTEDSFENCLYTMIAEEYEELEKYWDTEPNIQDGQILFICSTSLMRVPKVWTIMPDNFITLKKAKSILYVHGIENAEDDSDDE